MVKIIIKKILTLKRLDEKELFYSYLAMGVVSIVNIVLNLKNTNWAMLISSITILLLAICNILANWDFKK